MGKTKRDTTVIEYDDSIDWDRQDTGIEHVGTKITLPNEPGPMPLRAAIRSLERLAEDEETEMNVHEIIDAYPEDALVALNTAMKEKYGWASAVPKMSFFGPQPPQLITVHTGPKAGQTIQVPYGQFALPGVENMIEVHRTTGHTGPCLAITGSVRKRESGVLKELARLTREVLKDRSIYKGKAIRLRTDDDGNINYDRPPEFLETDYIKEEELILNPIELGQVAAALWAPVQNTEACRKHGIPLNRGVLLEGPYGCGKTMAANVTSKVCVDNGWTYILLDDVRALKEALLFAQRYAPAVVFAEDVDRVAEERDQKGNDLLNTIDGVLTKNAAVITVLTTNHVEKINRAMLRPGRLDAVVSVKAPEAAAVERLLRQYGRGLIGADEDLTEVGDFLAGNIPATVREVVERSKLSMIGGGRDKVVAQDLLVAAHGMQDHLALLREEPKKMSDAETLGTTFEKIVRREAGLGDTDLEDDMDALSGDIKKNTATQIAAAQATMETTAKGVRALNGPLKKIADKVTEIHEEVV